MDSSFLDSKEENFFDVIEKIREYIYEWIGTSINKDIGPMKKKDVGLLKSYIQTKIKNLVSYFN